MVRTRIRKLSLNPRNLSTVMKNVNFGLDKNMFYATSKFFFRNERIKRGETIQ